jgi:hypothetical protein
MHVLRSVCPNGSQKKMLLPCLTPNPKWVICLLPAKKKVTGILPMYPLYWGTDVPSNMLSYIFLCCDYIATIFVPQFFLLPTITCIQTYHVPKSPAEMQKSQLWTLILITFFWLGSFIPNLTKILIYIYVYIYQFAEVCSFSEQLKKIRFLKNPL